VKGTETLGVDKFAGVVYACYCASAGGGGWVESWEEASAAFCLPTKGGGGWFAGKGARGGISL